MAHKFLALETDLIPQETKDNVPSYLTGYFSNDGSRLLIDGYNDAGDLVHPQSSFDAWLQWSDNPQEIQDALLSTAIEYTTEEINEEKANPDSIWYTGDMS